MGAVLPASTTRVSGPHQTGPAPSCRRLTNTSQPERIIRSRLGSAQLRLRPYCWTRRNVSSLSTIRQRVSWSVSRLSSGPLAPGTPIRPGNPPPPPASTVSTLLAEPLQAFHRGVNPNYVGEKICSLLTNSNFYYTDTGLLGSLRNCGGPGFCFNSLGQCCNLEVFNNRDFCPEYC